MKTRLNVAMRDRLMAMAKDFINVAAEQQAVDRVYDRAKETMKREVLACFPPADMEILKRYDLIEKLLTVRFVYVDEALRQHYAQFSLPPNQNAEFFVVPARSFNVKMSAKASEVLKKLEAAQATLHTKLTARLSDYRALVYGHATLEAVEEVWPEASKLRPSLGCRAVSTLSPDVLSRIQADVKRRERAERATA